MRWMDTWKRIAAPWASRRLWLLALLGVLSGSLPALGASVYNCSVTSDKCVIKLEEGIIGDRVRVLDEKARVVASGRIIKRRGSYAVIALSDTNRTVRKGYPVIVDVENRASSLQWAASFSNDH